MFGDPPAEDHGQLVRSAEFAIGIQESVAQSIERCATAEAGFRKFHLREEQLMSATMLAPF
jgi:hypothetical protein